jgi:hypothetical protein
MWLACTAAPIQIKDVCKCFVRAVKEVLNINDPHGFNAALLAESRSISTWHQHSGERQTEHIWIFDVKISQYVQAQLDLFYELTI